MARKVKLEAEHRTETGKGAARSLRAEGYVPAVLYGRDEETKICKVEHAKLERLLTSVSWENTLIELKLDGEDQRVLIREVQIHPVRPQVLHVDFLAVHKGEKLRLEVPVHLVGHAPGVEEGGIMEHHRHELEIRCDPDAIPETLELDVSGMEVGDSLTVGDLRAPEGVEIFADTSTAICSVVPPTVIKVEEPEVEELEALEGEELEEGEEREEGEEPEEGEEGEPSAEERSREEA